MDLLAMLCLLQGISCLVSGVIASRLLGIQQHLEGNRLSMYQYTSTVGEISETATFQTCEELLSYMKSQEVHNEICSSSDKN